MSETTLIDVLNEEIRAAAEQFGLPAPLAADLTDSAVDRIRLRVGGTGNGYIAKVDRRRRREELRAKFTGNNLPALALEYGITLRHARRLIAR